MKNWKAFCKMYLLVLVSHECLEDQKKGHEVETILDTPKIFGLRIFAVEVSRELLENTIPQHKHCGCETLGPLPAGFP